MKRLSEREKLVLGAIEHRARVDLTEIADELGIKAAALRYSISRLKEEGVIRGIAPFIDPYVLGFSDYTIFFTFSNVTKERRQIFLDRAGCAPGVSWIARFGGRYSHAISILAKDVMAARKTFYGLCETEGNIIGIKSLSARTSFIAFGRQYMSSLETIPLAFGRHSKHLELDEKDRVILHYLSERNFKSIQEMSRETGVPYATLFERIQKLEHANVIPGYIYRFNLAAAGINTYRLLIYGQGVDPKLPRELLDFAGKQENVIHFISCLGSWDYELGVEVSEAANITDIVDELYEKFPEAIDSIEVMQLFEHLKYSGYPFPIK